MKKQSYNNNHLIALSGRDNQPCNKCCHQSTCTFECKPFKEWTKLGKRQDISVISGN